MMINIQLLSKIGLSLGYSAFKIKNISEIYSFIFESILNKFVFPPFHRRNYFYGDWGKKGGGTGKYKWKRDKKSPGLISPGLPLCKM